MPTRRDYFELLSFEQQEKYKQEYLRQNNKPTFEKFLKAKCVSVKQFISNGFVFDISKDGYDYWYSLSNGNLCLPEWVDVYLNVDVQQGVSIIKKDCRHIRLPNLFADAIAEDLLLNNIIMNYVIVREEDMANIRFEENIID